jgi:hypothetical protein
MTVYTVHEPPLRDSDTQTDAARFAFVRDGFHVWAFLLGPIWMIWRRLWLVLLLYVVAVAALGIGLTVLGASGVLRFGVGFLVALLVGLEASTLRRWTLARRGWTLRDVVAAPDRDTAERRFYDAWSGRGAALPPVPPAGSLTMPASGPASTDVMGLFPEPEPSR